MNWSSESSGSAPALSLLQQTKVENHLKFLHLAFQINVTSREIIEAKLQENNVIFMCKSICRTDRASSCYVRQSTSMCVGHASRSRPMADEDGRLKTSRKVIIKQRHD